jgi:murein DD-endopeptidase MepM/ murein hydrolase activator NlpD
LLGTFFGKNQEAQEGPYAHGEPFSHVEDFSSGDHDPFDQHPPAHHRWLLTTCAAGVTGCLIIAGAIVGLFGDQQQATGTVLASVDATVDHAELWQRPSVTTKGDFNGQIAKAIAMQPLKPVSVAYAPKADTKDDGNTNLLLEATRLTTASLNNYPEVDENTLPYSQGTQPYVLEGELGSATLDTSNITTITKTPPAEPTDQTVVLADGENLGDKLRQLGISPSTSQALTSALEPVFPARLLRSDQAFTITVDRQQDFYGNDVIYPVQVSFSPGPNEDILIEADEDGRFIARVDGATDGTRSRYASSPHYISRGKVRSSLYATATDDGVPDYIINQMIKAFSFDVDFQRQVKAGDEFEMFYGQPLSGSSKKRKVLHYAKLNVRGKPKTYYRFTTADGKTRYFDDQGRSASSRSLMRTPISGARISSGFGMRRHPILGYTKMHTGMDFAVPYGTPIRSAGSGVVKHAAWKGAYGRTVMVKHPNGYTTLYAHMSRVASGLKRGHKVRQGQVIGYVGSSGRSTGPHLHYEVRRKGKPLNPKRIRTAEFVKLKGKDLANFKKYKKHIMALAKAAPRSTRYAQADTTQ